MLLAPLLAGLDASDRSNPSGVNAEDFAVLNWPKQDVVAIFGTIPVPDKRHARDCARVKRFAEQYGRGIFLLCGAVTAYDNMNACLVQIEIENFDSSMVFHDPDEVVRYFIYGVGLLQEELADLS